MSRYTVMPAAAIDLLNVCVYIAADSVEAAERVEGEFYDTFQSLAKMPGQGHKRPDYTKRPVLFFPLYSYLIVYKPETRPLEIIAIVHGGRNVKRILRSRNV